MDEKTMVNSQYEQEQQMGTAQKEALSIQTQRQRPHTDETKNGMAQLQQRQTPQQTSMSILSIQIMPQRQLSISPHASMRSMEERKMPIHKGEM